MKSLVYFTIVLFIVVGTVVSINSINEINFLTWIYFFGFSILLFYWGIFQRGEKLKFEKEEFIITKGKKVVTRIHYSEITKITTYLSYCVCIYVGKKQIWTENCHTHQDMVNFLKNLISYDSNLIYKIEGYLNSSYFHRKS